MGGSDLFSLAGFAALITALSTGVGGTWLALRKFKADRNKGQIDVEAALRDELRKDNATLRTEMKELQEQVQKLFQENLDLRHENNNNRMKIRSLESQVAKLATNQNTNTRIKAPKHNHKKTHQND